VTTGVELLFVQKKAVGAVQVASCPGWLGQHMNSRRQVFICHEEALEGEKKGGSNIYLKDSGHGAFVNEDHFEWFLPRWRSLN
jgi:hypothetical protein